MGGFGPLSCRSVGCLLVFVDFFLWFPRFFWTLLALWFWLWPGSGVYGGGLVAALLHLQWWVCFCSLPFNVLVSLSLSLSFDIAYPTSTAVDRPHSLLAPIASMDKHGREVLSPAYQSCLGPHDLVGSVPLCCAEERAATAQHDLRHRCYTPVRAARGKLGLITSYSRRKLVWTRTATRG